MGVFQLGMRGNSQSLLYFCESTAGIPSFDWIRTSVKCENEAIPALQTPLKLVLAGRFFWVEIWEMRQTMRGSLRPRLT